MSNQTYLLDTSALLTLIEDEAGAERVEQLLSGAEVTLPWLALLETYYITMQERGQAEAEHRYALARQLPATILWRVDEKILLTAARLKAEHPLSLADAIIAALALQEKFVLVHKDPELECLSGTILLEALPYKKGE